MPTPDDRTALRRNWPSAALLLAAFSLFSPLSLLAVNAPRGAPAGKFLVIAAAAFVLSLVLVGVLARWLGLRRATAVVVVVLAVFFTWSLLGSLGKALPGPHWLKTTAIPILILGLLLWGAMRFGSRSAFQISIAAMGVALVATPLPALLAWYTGEPAHIELPAAIPHSAATQYRDVYFLVLDGYGRNDVLEDVYGFSNQEFIAALESAGFQIPVHSRSGYSSTAGSVASTLAMDYLIEDGTVPDHRLTLALHDVIRGSNPVVETLHNAGYRYVHIESGWDGARCGPQVDTCYEASFFDEAVATLVGRTPLASIVETRFGHPFALNGLGGLEAIQSEAATARSEPRFVFAHVVLPHPPLTLDRNCDVRPEPQPGGGAVGARFLLGTGQLEERRAGYVEQIECVNSHILRFIPDLDDDALVIITGDHGPDSFGQMSVAPAEWTNQDIWERFAVFSAYRVPEQCGDWITSDVNLINGMRAVLGCATGTELAPRQDRAYIFPLADGLPYPTTEVNIEVLGG